MRGKKLLLWIPLAALLLLAGVVLWAWNADLGRFKPQIETLVSEGLERQFQLGQLQLRLGAVTEISARDLRLANPGWADSEDLLKIGSLHARVRLASLFRPPLVVERLDIADVEIQAEHSEEQGGSWSFPALRGAEGRTDTPKEGLPILVRHLQLDRLTLHLERPGDLPPLEARIESMNQEHRSDDLLALTVAGSLNGETIEYAGTVGPVAAIRAGRNVRFDGDGQVGSLAIEGRGLIDDLAAPHHPTLDLTLSAPDIAEVASMLRLPAPPPAPFRLEAEVEADGDRLKTRIHATSGETRIALDGHSTGLLDLSRFEYGLQAAGPNLGALTRFLQLGEWPEQPFTASGSILRDGQVLTIESVDISVGSTAFSLDARLNQFPDLTNARAEFDLRGDDAAGFRELFGLRGVAVGPFEARGSLQARNGQDNELSISLRTEIGEARVEGTLGPGPGYAGTTLHVRIDGDNARRLFDGYGVPGFLPEPFSTEAHLTIGENGIEFGRAAVATLGEDRLEFEGYVSFTPLEAGTDVRFRASGDDLSEFVFLSGASLPIAARPYELESGLRITPEGFQIDGLSGRIDGNQVRIDGLVTRKTGRTGTNLTFAAEGQNLETLIRDTPTWDVPAEAFSASGQLRLFGESMALDDLEISVGELKATARAELPMPLDDLQLRIDATLSGPNVNVIVPRVEGLVLAPNPFVLDLDLAVAGGSWRFDDSQLRLGEANLLIDGRATIAPELSASDLSFQLQVPSLSAIGKWRGLPYVDLPLNVDGRVSGTGGTATMKPLRLRLGGTDVTGEATYTTSGSVPAITVDTQSNRIDWAELLAFFRSPRDSGASARDADGRLIPDFAFPLDAMKQVDVQAHATARELRGIINNPRDLELVASLADGVLQVESFRAKGYRGDMRASGSLVPDPDGAAATVDVSVELDDVILNLVRGENVPPEKRPVLNASAQLSGRGPDLRSVAASLNGSLRADGGPGTIPANALSFFDAGILEQLFSAIVPPDRKNLDTQQRCLATRLMIDNGVVQARPGAMIVTDKVQIITQGRIDLRDESISLNFETHPTKAYQANISEVLVNPFVKISGTLAEPKLTLDTSRAALHTGAAIATAGWSILAKGLLDRLSQSKDPCAEFVREEQ